MGVDFWVVGEVGEFVYVVFDRGEVDKDGDFVCEFVIEWDFFWEVGDDEWGRGGGVLGVGCLFMVEYWLGVCVF